jgi:hypothetical protein
MGTLKAPRDLEREAGLPRTAHAREGDKPPQRELIDQLL